MAIGSKGTLERVDVNGNYCKENCIWVSKQDQAKNKRNTLYVNYEGQKVKVQDLALKLGINYHTLYGRLFSYKITEGVFSPKKLPSRAVPRKGEAHNLSKLTVQKVLEIRRLYAAKRYFQKDIAKMFGICQSEVSHIVLGKIWTMPEAFPVLDNLLPEPPPTK